MMKTNVRRVTLKCIMSIQLHHFIHQAQRGGVTCPKTRSWQFPAAKSLKYSSGATTMTCHCPQHQLPSLGSHQNGCPWAKTRRAKMRGPGWKRVSLARQPRPQCPSGGPEHLTLGQRLDDSQSRAQGPLKLAIFGILVIINKKPIKV